MQSRVLAVALVLALGAAAMRYRLSKENNNRTAPTTQRALPNEGRIAPDDLPPSLSEDSPIDNRSAVATPLVSSPSPSEPPPSTAAEDEKGLSEKDIDALHEHFAHLYNGYSRDLLSAQYEIVMDRIPHDVVRTIHQEKRDQGEYGVLDKMSCNVVVHPDGSHSASFTPQFLASMKPVLQMYHGPIDGAYVLTDMKSSEMPQYEQSIVEANWLMTELRKAQ